MTAGPCAPGAGASRPPAPAAPPRTPSRGVADRAPHGEITRQTQPKIGYGDQDRYGGNAGWQQPELNNDAIDDAFFPLLRWTDFIVQPRGLGVTIDGAPLPFGPTPVESYWTTGTTPALPTFSVNQTQPDQYLEVFSRG